MQMAFLVASKSKDTSMKCGAVAVSYKRAILSTGFNGFPRRADDTLEHRYERPEKYFWTEHAERNTIYNAALNGVGLDGATMYVTGHPCVDCARGIIQSGFHMVVIPTQDSDPFFLEQRWDDWEESFKRTKELFAECGVVLREMKYAV